MIGDYAEIKQKYSDLIAEQKYINSEIKKAQSTIKEQKRYYADTLAARTLIQTAAEATQKNLEEQISTLVTLGINSIFPENTEFKLEFNLKRGKTECSFHLLDVNGNRVNDILGSDGGGLGDIISFCLRVAFWKLDKGRPILISDEPFRFLHSSEYQANTSEMIQMLSKDLGLQMVIVSDQNDIVGDKLFRVTKGKVKEIV